MLWKCVLPRKWVPQVPRAWEREHHGPKNVHRSADAACAGNRNRRPAHRSANHHPAPAWLKPVKFAISIAIYVFTLAWAFTLIPEWRKTRRVVGWATAIAMVLEFVIIALQAYRGTTSHFNFSTPFNSVLFVIMGVAIVAQTPHQHSRGGRFLAAEAWRPCHGMGPSIRDEHHHRRCSYRGFHDAPDCCSAGSRARRTRNADHGGAYRGGA